MLAALQKETREGQECKHKNQQGGSGRSPVRHDGSDQGNDRGIKKDKDMRTYRLNREHEVKKKN